MRLKQDDQLDQFVSAVNERLRKRRQQNEEVAPDFSCFRHLRLNENQVSDMLAELLDPEEAHDQGTLFLDELLQVVGVKVDEELRGSAKTPALPCFSGVF